MLRLLPRSVPSRCLPYAARTFGTAAATAPAGVSRHRAIALTRAAAAQVQASQGTSVVQAPPREAWLERSLEDDQCVAITRLDPFVWDTPKRVDVVHSVVRWHLANRRQGTAMARTVSQIRGSRRKLYRQKGTGNARHGTRRVNLFVGGAKAHGPVPRDHSHRLPVKVRRMALRVVLSDKLNSGNLIVLEDGSFSSPKTKDLAATLAERGLERTPTLFVDTEIAEDLYLASRNIKYFDVLPASTLHTYALLKRTVLILTSDAAEELEVRLAKK